MRKYYFLGILLIAALCAHEAFSQSAENRTLTVDEMFSLAEKNNHQIQFHTTGIHEAREAVGIARNAYLPSIDASLSLRYNGDGTIMDRDFTHGFKAPIPSFGNNFVIEVSQVIYAAGAIKSGVEIAGLQTQMAALNAEHHRDEIYFLIIGTSLEICKIDNQLRVFESHIAQADKMLENMHARHKEGTVLHNDITRYELRLQNLDFSKIQLQNRRQLLNNRLTSALGLPRSLVITPDMNSLRGGAEDPIGAFDEGGKMRQPKEVDAASQVTNRNNGNGRRKLAEEGPTVQGWRQQALSTSPLLKMADTKVKMNGHHEKIARADRHPKVALFASNHLNGPVTIDIPAINKNFNYWAVGVGVTYNISSLYTSPKKIRASRVAIRRAEEEKSVAEEQLLLEVDAAVIEYREAFDLHATRQKSMELAARNYEVIRYRYENDLALITDLLDASTQKLESELQEANARIDILYNYYKLKYISGTI